MFRIIKSGILTVHRTNGGLKRCIKNNCEWCAKGAEKLFGIHCVEEETGFERMVFLTGTQLAKLIEYRRRQEDRIGVRFEIKNGELKIVEDKEEDVFKKLSDVNKELEMMKADLELSLKLLEKAIERLDSYLKGNAAKVN